MKKRFVLPLGLYSERVMQRVGYTYHCGTDGRPCYHRQLNDPEFPRFHAYVVETNGIMEINLHFDAHDIVERKGNHDQQWAYEGGRVGEEMRRISDILEGHKIPQVSGTERLEKKERTEKPSKNWFDLFFG